MDVTEGKNIITDEDPEEVVIDVVIRVIAALIGGILSAMKNLAEWIYYELDWDFIKKAFIFFLAVSIPACIGGMFLYNLEYNYPHCQTLCVKYASNAMECFSKCKGKSEGRK